MDVMGSSFPFRIADRTLRYPRPGARFGDADLDMAEVISLSPNLNASIVSIYAR